MAEDLLQHKFNDDLLLAKPDRDVAARRYPTILHVLDNQEVRGYFREFDEPANRAKRSGLKAGFRAVVLGCVALWVTSAEHLVPDDYAILPAIAARNLPASFVESLPYLSTCLAVIAALAGILCVMIGGLGILFAGKKEAWLHGRFMTERIRQFHFQSFVTRVPEILASLNNADPKTTYEAAKREWMDAFRARHQGKVGAEFTKILQDERGSHLWLHENCAEHGAQAEAKKLDPLFQAYRELRIIHQLGYAHYKLTNDHRILSKAPPRQAELLSAITFIGIVLLCAIHVGALIAVFVSGPFSSAFRSQAASVVVIWIAVAALGARALAEGLQPERETERYQQYGSAVHAILDRFDLAQTQAEKLRIMREMERLSYDEMRNFLLTNERAKFVL
jgi:hypothetical protein